MQDKNSNNFWHKDDKNVGIAFYKTNWILTRADLD